MNDKSSYNEVSEEMKVLEDLAESNLDLAWKIHKKKKKFEELFL